MNARNLLGGNDCVNRLWLVAVIFLWAQVAAIAQPYVLELSPGSEVMDERKRAYGSIHFTATLTEGIKIDESTYDFAGEQEAVLELKLRVEGSNRKWDRRMIVGVAEKSFRMLNKQHWQPAKAETILLSKEGGEKLLKFKVKEPGTYNIVLQYVFLDKDDNNFIDPDNWPAPPAENTIITKPVTILNLPTAVDREWDRIKKSNQATDILDFVLSARGQGKLAEGTSIITRLVEKDGEVMIYRDDKPAPKQAFIAKYGKYRGLGFPIIDNRLEMAHKSLEEDSSLPPPPPPPPAVREPGPKEKAAVAWANAITQRDTQLLIEYRSLYAGDIPANDAVIPDSLSCWSPSTSRPLKSDNSGLIRIQLNNFIAPAYYDIYEGRLKIDDEILRNQKLLSIDVLRSGKFKLTIVDKGCPHKILEIPLDNLMSAAVTADTILGVYNFRFEGGTRPYALQLIPEEGGGQGLLREKITGSTFTLSVDSLQAAGLEGKYTASAYSRDSDSPVAVAGPTIDVPARPWPSWILPALIVAAIGAMALLLLFILRSGKPRQRTIFEEA